MLPLRLIFSLLVMGLSANVWAGPRPIASPTALDSPIQIGNSQVVVDSRGNIRVRTPGGEIAIAADSTSIIQDGHTDIYLDPNLLNAYARPVFGNPLLNPFAPMPGAFASERLNRLSAYFSTASGGFGFRIAFDRRLSSHLRFLASPEFLTYSPWRAAHLLGNALPAGTTRVTLFALPIGLQRQFAPQNRVVPHIGFGIGPMVRFDHRSPRPGYYPHGGIGIGASSGYDAFSLSIPLFLDDYPDLSLTLGGHVHSGLNIRLGAQKDMALTLEGRYTLARFIDALGNPGDFSGFSLSVGFGKYF